MTERAGWCENRAIEEEAKPTVEHSGLEPEIA